MMCDFLLELKLKSIIPNIEDMRNILNIKEGYVIPVLTPFTFDPSVVDIFCALNYGGTLLVFSEALKKKLDSVWNILVKENVTIIQCTPSLLYQFEKYTRVPSLLSVLSSLKHLIIGGEKFPHPTHIHNWFSDGYNENLLLHNIYGVTELSIVWNNKFFW